MYMMAGSAREQQIIPEVVEVSSLFTLPHLNLCPPSSLNPTLTSQWKRFALGCYGFIFMTLYV